MSQAIRQSELFASQDWQVLYRAFTQINFNATDPASINEAMRAYIRANYPEDFNDWIESSEFVAYIDLIAFVAGNLAFKMDINARENFWEVAEARESILRLARFLSYNPRRCQSARGLLKLVAVSTNDDVFDSAGSNLNGLTVQWDNPDDRNWYERFIAILNNALVQTNPFGIPLTPNSTVSGIPTHLYRVNGVVGENEMKFSARVGNVGNTQFEICNGGFDDGESFYERTPNRSAPMHFFYRNDGAGNGSARTGFFFLFKQGSLNQTTFTINQPQANRVLDIPATNINDNDVWVQTVEDNGQVIYDWTKVPAIFSENITFNSLSATERNIFSVITRDEDRISIRFSDGIFGEAPVGNVRVWYRSANGKQYAIRPSEMSNVTVPLVYYNRRGSRKTLNLTFALQEAVGNAAERESENQIRRRAPSVFGTQNRMVTGEDYNVFPLSSNLIKKLKTVVRVYSGHSRFIDLNDPTGTYQHTSVIADDGILYHETFNRYTEVPTTFNRTPEEMLLLHIQPLIESDEVRAHAQKILMDRVIETGFPSVPVDSVWRRVSSAVASSTGYFTHANDYYTVGANLLISYQQNGRTVEEWVAIGGIRDDATSAPISGQRYGSVTLNQNIPDGATVLQIVPAFVQVIDAAAAARVKDSIEQRQSFSLWFNPQTAAWSVEAPETLSSDANALSRLPALKIASIDYSGSGYWRVAARGTRLAFESERAVKWYHSGSRAIDPETGARREDTIRIIRINGNLDTDAPLGRDYDLSLRKLIQYGDGSTEASRIQAALADADEDGQPDIPDTFNRIISNDRRLKTLFWRKAASGDTLTTFKPYYGIRVYQHDSDRFADTGPMTPVDGEIVAYQVDAADPSEAGTFWVWDGDEWLRDTQRFKVATGRGANMGQFWRTSGVVTPTTDAERDAARLNFHWKHYADSDHRIDPSRTVILDAFVLTDEYDYAIRQWVANGALVADLPTPPSELDLRLTFREYEKSKMHSDTLVWRPVRYKLLFGPGADETLRGQIKIVRLPNAILSDGEIKSRVVRAINDYFAAEAWDFGSTFYFSELSAYIMTQLIGSVASVEIVPMFADASFGDLREITSRSDELFISTAQVSDIQIIGANTPGNLRMR